MGCTVLEHPESFGSPVAWCSCFMLYCTEPRWIRLVLSPHMRAALLVYAAILYAVFSQLATPNVIPIN